MSEAAAGRRGRRRKPPEDRQSVELHSYLTVAEYDAVALQAIRAGNSVSAFVRERLLMALGITQDAKRGAV